MPKAIDRVLLEELYFVLVGEAPGRDLGQVPAVQPAQHRYVRRSQAELLDESAERSQDPSLPRGERQLFDGDGLTGLWFYIPLKPTKIRQ